MQTMGDEADGYGARFSIDLACVSPGHSRFKVEFSCGRHIDAVLGDMGDILVGGQTQSSRFNCIYNKMECQTLLPRAGHSLRLHPEQRNR